MTDLEEAVAARSHFRNVASPAAGERLLLRALADSKQQPDHGLLRTISRPVVRECRSGSSPLEGPAPLDVTAAGPASLQLSTSPGARCELRRVHAGS